ncbi:NAD(P)H-binding protein [Streptomyces sp. NPDC005805]|uniref:NAD(P)H-binding protein n=1 Tax=Streptomyces sp. NPDC005805 TaxID=3157068 RepID=UPI00340EE951
MTNEAVTGKPILVLGGTGKTGRRVAEQLRAGGHAVRAASRSGDTRFDWYDESTWAAALEGAGAVYMVDMVDEPVEWNPEESVRSFCRQAAAAGVGRIVLLQARTNEDAGGKSLIGSEDEVRDSGLEWTILRPGWFTQNFDEGILLDGIRAGEVRLPAGEGKEPFIDCDDVAAVAVAALTEDGHAGRVYELSGPRLLTFGEAVAEIAAATGREIRYVALTADEYVAELVAEGVPEDYARMVADLIGQIRKGKGAYLSTGVQDALGRAPRDVSEWAKQAAATGVWDV